VCIWIVAVLPVLARVSIHHCEYFHDKLTELRAANLVGVPPVLNKSSKSTATAISAAIPCGGGNVLFEHTVRHGRNLIEIGPVVYELF
jgi:hypothetical protein